MSAPQFTPGPWVSVLNKFGESVLIQPATDRTLFLLDDGETTDWNADETDANARLIAAAPQLYDACVYTLDALNRLRGGFELSPRNAVRDAALLMIDQHLDLLETALFKARGDQ